MKPSQMMYLVSAIYLAPHVSASVGITIGGALCFVAWVVSQWEKP